MKRRDKLYKEARTRKDSALWTEAKSLRNTISSMCKKAKRDYVSSRIKNNQNNPHQFWKELNTIWLNTTEKSKTEINLINPEDNKNCGGEKVSSIFNEYFVNVGNNLQQKIIPLSDNEEKILTEHMSTKTPTRPNTTFQFRLISETELKRQIAAIDIHKNSGIKQISMYLLKISFKLLIAQLLHTINSSIRTGIFPEAWKTAIFTPLFKSGNQMEPQNYRPIVCLPLPSKIMEKLIHSQYYAYLEEKKHLNNIQFGYRKNRGTVNAINKFLSYIYESLNNNKYVSATYIDFKKAFDSVHHNTLIKIISETGVHGTELNWIKSYLSNRNQSVIANGILSPELVIDYGVPQGRTLGPLMFVIYVNSMNLSLSDYSMVMYADDTVIYGSNRHLFQLQDDSTKNLSSVMTWCRKNKLSINITKTKIMIFSPRKKERLNLKYLNVGNHCIEIVNEYNYLGLKINEKLDFISHIKMMIRNLGFKLKHFRRIRSCLDKTTAFLMYKTMISPIFSYANSFIFAASSKLLKKLQTLQNQFLRVILKVNKRTNVDDQRHALNILTTYNERKIKPTVLGVQEFVPCR